MVRKLFIFLAAVLMFSLLNVPAFAADGADESPVKLRHTMAFVASVDAVNNKVMVRHRLSGNGEKVLDVSSALLVDVTTETAKVISVTDLKSGDKLEVWLLSAKDAAEMKAVLVVRVPHPSSPRLAAKTQKFLTKAKKIQTKAEKFMKKAENATSSDE